jgi:hypothetical protein
VREQGSYQLLQDKAHLVWGDKKNFELLRAGMTVKNKALKGIDVVVPRVWP